MTGGYDVPPANLAPGLQDLIGRIEALEAAESGTPSVVGGAGDFVTFKGTEVDDDSGTFMLGDPVAVASQGTSIAMSDDLTGSYGYELLQVAEAGAYHLFGMFESTDDQNGWQIRVIKADGTAAPLRYQVPDRADALHLGQALRPNAGPPHEAWVDTVLSLAAGDALDLEPRRVLPN